MPSAPDLITYIGVPITVLGMLPILWNIAKSFIIRYRLSKSIPWEIRPFYSISADPANGNVMVYVPSLLCVHTNLWEENSDEKWPLSMSMRFKRWSHKAFHASILHCKIWLIFMPWKWSQTTIVFQLVARYSSLPIPSALINRMSSLSAVERGLRAIENRTQGDTTGLRGILEANVLRSSRRGVLFWQLSPFKMDRSKYLYRPWMMIVLNCGLQIHYSDMEKRIDTRSTVNIDMSIEKHAPLAMGWQDFVLFALAIGIDPKTLKPEQEKFELLRYNSNLKVLRGSRDGDDLLLGFQLNEENEYSVHRALSWFNIMGIERKDELKCLAMGHDTMTTLSSDNFHNPLRHGSDPKDCRDPFAAALSWRFYDHRVFLDYQKREWSFLARMIKRQLHDSDHGAFDLANFRRHELMDRLEGHHVPLGMPKFRRFVPVSQQLLEVRERSLCVLKALERRSCLKKMVFSLLGYNVDGSIMEDTDESKAPAQVFDSLRLAINDSAYVEESERFWHILQDISAKLEVTSTDPLSRDISIHVDVGWLVRTSSTLLEGFEGRPSPATKETQENIVGIPELQDKVSKLLSWFDPFSDNYTPEKINLMHSFENVSDEVENMSESIGMTLLAHIVLALNDWGDLPRQTWELDLEFKTLLGQLQNDFDKKDAFKKTLKKALEHAERGIYTAPSDKEMVSELLNEETDRMVYLY
ncbi:hypothetical protein HDK90DRAFT_123548 [Phyllosticta capitalensis]|uniref:Uncharacterized protein n=1 Tax=Phyllosticta capitalensis TaxID=121624 RepID=A0ABR1YY47_9PEZI